MWGSEVHRVLPRRLEYNKYDDVLCVPLAGQPWEERTSRRAGGARTQGESLGWRLSHCTKLSPNTLNNTPRRMGSLVIN